MQSDAIDHLHERSIEALDATYADLLRLARQGTPGAKAQLHEIVDLRARLTGDTSRQDEQRREIEAIVTA